MNKGLDLGEHYDMLLCFNFGCGKVLCLNDSIPDQFIIGNSSKIDYYTEAARVFVMAVAGNNVRETWDIVYRVFIQDQKTYLLQQGYRSDFADRSSRKRSVESEMMKQGTVKYIQLALYAGQFAEVSITRKQISHFLCHDCVRNVIKKLGPGILRGSSLIPSFRQSGTELFAVGTFTRRPLEKVA